MEQIVGVVQSISGQMVKKDFEKGVESPLQVGDLISMGDYVWSRSLDAKALIKLKNADVKFKPGMRIKFDKEYLQKVGSYEIIDRREAEVLLNSAPPAPEAPKPKPAPKAASQTAAPKAPNQASAPKPAPKPAAPKEKEIADISSTVVVDLGGIDTASEAEIFVTPLFSSVSVTPKIVEDITIYSCDFNDIKVNVRTMPGRTIALYDINRTKQMAKSVANDEGLSSFELKNIHEGAKYEFCIVVYENNQEMFKEKIRLEAVPSHAQASAFSPVKILDFNIARDVNKDGIEFVDAIGISIDAMRKREEDYPISKVYYTNEINPVFEFISQHDFETKFYLVGFADFIFDEMVEVDGVVRDDGMKLFFICQNNFKVPGRYTFYANFIPLDKSKSPQEFFFDVNVKFENTNSIASTEVKDGVIEGHVVSNDNYPSKVVLYSQNAHNVFNEITAADTDEDGNFTINLKYLDLKDLKNRMVLRNIDIYGNKGAAIGVKI